MSDVACGGMESLKSRIESLELECSQLRDFAALAAHELLRPVIMAQACAARLSDVGQGAPVDEGVRTDLELFITASSQVRVLVDTLLADAQRGDAALDAEPVDLALVVRDCLPMLASEIEARGFRVRVEELPVVPGDAVLLAAVFRNLLVNAVRHGSGRHGEIRVFAELVADDWRLAVDSPGAPLSDADRKALLEIPSRSRDGRRVRGAGLGLVLVRRIVERHGGRVGAMSPDDQTNRFFFTLPADPAQLPALRRR